MSETPAHPEADVDLLALHHGALGSTARFVDGTSPDHLALPTPCERWDVRALLDHVVGGNLAYARAARGVAPEWGAREADQLGDDHRGAYARSPAALVAAHTEVDVLAAPHELPFGVLPGATAVAIHFVDVLVHGWDLAVATGQDPTLDPSLCEAALEVATTYPDDAWGDGRFFSVRRTTAGDAAPHERLVALLGRDVDRWAARPRRE